MRLAHARLALSLLLASLSFAMLARAQLDQLANTTPEQRAKGLTEIMKMMEMRQINEKKEAELQTLLTPDQFAKYEASKEDMREKFEEKMEEKAQSGAH